MKNLYGFFAACCLSLFLIGCMGDSNTYVTIETEYGNMKVLLYDETPKHKENFIKLVSEGFYNDLLFHRVIDGFMLQGGDPDSRNAPAGTMLGSGGPGYLIDAEIGAPHLKGALAAARTGAGNPEKKSSGSQFYIVQGNPVTNVQLDALANFKKIKYSEAQKALYAEIGGRPDLDQDYTVFGEIVEGLDVVDKIAKVPVDKADRPEQDVKMQIRMGK